MSKYPIYVHRTWRGIRVCATCQTELENRELFHCTHAKTWHVNKDICAINKKRTKLMIALDRVQEESIL